MRRSAACPSLLTIANLASLGGTLSVTCATESGTWTLTCIDAESCARAIVATLRTRLPTRIDFMENSGRVGLPELREGQEEVSETGI
jgi:hypothetical protein